MVNIKYLVKRHNLLMLILVIGIIWAFFGVITEGNFLSARNISNLFRQMSVVGILSIGMAFIIITGNIDLSVGSMLSLLGAIGAILFSYNVPLIFVLFGMVVIGAFLGFCNGWWYSYKKVPSFIVTLSGLLIYRGIVLFITKGQTIQIDNVFFNAIGSSSIPAIIGWGLGIAVIFSYAGYQIIKSRSSEKLYSPIPINRNYIIKIGIVSIIISYSVAILNSYRGIPIPLLILLVLFIIATFLLEYTTYGRTVFAIGGNAEAAKYSGINIQKYYLSVFIFNGVIISISSMINTARLASAVPSTGTNTELDAIAACVIGGISLVGGSGSILGAVLGALIIASINNGMSFIGLDSAWQNTVKGLVLLLAVWLDVSSRKS